MERQIEKAREFIQAKKERSKNSWLKIGDMQFFAKDTGEGSNEDEDNDTDEDEDDHEEDEEESGPSLAQMIKDNPELKKEFNTLFKDRFNKRLKGIDLKEAKKALKLMEQKGQDDEEQDGEDHSKADEVKQKAQKLDRKLKRTAVKEYAVDNDLNPKLLARLIDLEKLDLDEDGELDPDELEEVVEELTEEFPEIFRADTTQENEDQEDGLGEAQNSKRRSHVVGSGKTNKKKKENLREIGKAKALERAKRKGLIK